MGQLFTQIPFSDEQGFQDTVEPSCSSCELVRSNEVSDDTGYSLSARGSVNQKVLPESGELSTPIVPPWASTASLQK